MENPSNTFVVNGNFDLFLQVTDQYGCKGDTTIFDYVEIAGPQGNPLALQNGNICAQGAGFVIQNPVDVDSVVWNMGDGTFVYNQMNFTYNYNNPGTYVASVTLINQAGCEITTVLDSVTVFDDGLNANFSANPTSVEQNHISTLTDLSTFLVNPITSWTWTVGNDTLASLNNGSQQTFSSPMSGVYTITLSVQDNLGCEDQYSLLVTVIDPILSIPNVVTPNGDGINDELLFSELYFKTYQVEIFNRWGDLIYTIKDQTGLAIWDAATQEGKPVTDGVYFYHILGTMLAGTLVDSHGFVTVIGSKK